MLRSDYMRAGTREPSDAPDSRYSWLRLAICTLISTIGGVGMWSFVVMLPAIQADFGITRGEASLPYTVLMVGFALGSIITGRLADRFGIRVTLVTGSLAAGIGFVLGVAFLTIQGIEWQNKTFGLTSGPYASLFFTVTGFHMAHVAMGLFMLLAVTVWSFLGYFGPARSAPVTIAAIYWHFVDAVWLFVFATYYLTPYLGFGR